MKRQREEGSELLFDMYKGNEGNLSHTCFIIHKDLCKSRMESILQLIDEINRFKDSESSEVKHAALSYLSIRLLVELSRDQKGQYGKADDSFLEFMNLQDEKSKSLNRMRNRFVHKGYEYTKDDIEGFANGFVSDLREEFLKKLKTSIEEINTPDLRSYNIYKKQLVTIHETKQEIKSSIRTANEISKDYLKYIDLLCKIGENDLRDPLNKYAISHTLIRLGELSYEIKENKLDMSQDLDKQDLEDIKYYEKKYHSMAHSSPNVVADRFLFEEVQHVVDQKSKGRRYGVAPANSPSQASAGINTQSTAR